jgi:hypothetical protein
MQHDYKDILIRIKCLFLCIFFPLRAIMSVYIVRKNKKVLRRRNRLQNFGSIVLPKIGLQKESSIKNIITHYFIKTSFSFSFSPKCKKMS